jgi:hypothetical protein
MYQIYIIDSSKKLTASLNSCRSYVIFKLNSAPKKHQEKVGRVQAQVRQWKDSGSDKPMCTARPGLDL